MRKLLYKLNIQLFGDGGGDGGAASSGTATDGAEGIVGGEIEIPADIPEKARKIYAKAMQKRGKVDTSQSVATPAAEANTPTVAEETVPPQKPSFKDLLKSDEDYKKEYEAAVQKAIKDRFKTQDAELAKYKSLVEKNAKKYGIDTSAEGYTNELEAAMERDDSYYEKYAEENDVSLETARKMVTTEEKLKHFEAAERDRQEQEENNRIMQELQSKAEAAKVKYPNLDLDTEMQSPEFRRLLAAVNGDVETAYFVTHRQEIMQHTVAEAARQAQERTVNNVRANQARPNENGLSSPAKADTIPSWKGKGLDGIRAYAEEQRRLRGR